MQKFTEQVELFAGRGEKMNLHIEEIHGINTHVSLMFGESVVVEINLTDFDRVMKIEIDETRKTFIKNGKLTTPDKFVGTLRSILKNVVVDNFSGEVVLPDFYPYTERSDISYLKELFDMEHIKFDFDMCSVCMSTTQTKTNCGHELCVICWTKILNTNKKCPLCRFDL